MSDDEINREVALACGWKYVLTNSLSADNWVSPSGDRRREPHNYCNDLNAMHFVERDFLRTLDQWRKYSDQLKTLIQGSEYPIGAVDARYRTVHATARQKAEAFLREFKKWKECEVDSPAMH